MEARLYIIASHGIDTRIVGDRLLAQDNWAKTLPDGNVLHGFHWVDVTDWLSCELYRWLGY